MYINTTENVYSVALVDDLLTRTTQIVLDPEDGNGPKLKEPRSLYSLGNYHYEPRYVFFFDKICSFIAAIAGC